MPHVCFLNVVHLPLATDTRQCLMDKYIFLAYHYIKVCDFQIISTVRFSLISRTVLVWFNLRQEIKMSYCLQVFKICSKMFLLYVILQAYHYTADPWWKNRIQNLKPVSNIHHEGFTCSSVFVDFTQQKVNVTQWIPSYQEIGKTMDTCLNKQWGSSFCYMGHVIIFMKLSYCYKT